MQATLGVPYSARPVPQYVVGQRAASPNLIGLTHSEPIIRSLRTPAPDSAQQAQVCAMIRDPGILVEAAKNGFDPNANPA